METKVLTALVPLRLAEKVDQIAARMERSRGWIVKQALGAWISQEEERVGGLVRCGFRACHRPSVSTRLGG